MSFLAILKRIGKPLASRKVRVALTTVIAAYAAEYGLGVSEEMIYTILGVGAAVVLGIAHEDNGAKSAQAIDPHVAETRDMWNAAETKQDA